MYFVQADEVVLDNEIRLKDSAAVFTLEQDKGVLGSGEEEEEEEFNHTAMGVGKNTTSRSLESISEAGNYEDENKKGAGFYPIPVHNLCSCTIF